MSFAELLANWSERDHRYSLRKSNGRPLLLTEDEITAIRVYRRREVNALPENDKRLGQVTLERWTPPLPAR